MEIVDFRALFEQSTALELVVDTNFTILAASNEYLKATKSSRDTIIGKDIFVAFPDNPNDTNANGEAMVRASINRVLQTNECDHLPITKYDIPKRDFPNEFEAKYWKPTHSPVFDHLNNLKYVIQRVEDVTERMILSEQLEEEKKAFKAVEESESYFRQLADIMPAKISNAEASGNVVFFNKQWLDYAGLSFDEMKGFGYHKIMHPDELEEFQKRLHDAAETGTDLEMEMRFRNNNGEYKWHLNIASPIKDENGNVKMWVGSTTEIHEQILLKEELEKAVKERTKELQALNLQLIFQNKEKEKRASELEETVTSRTRELRQSNEELLKINSDLDNFVYTASHDLKAPVSNIEGLITYLTKKIPADNVDSSKIIELIYQSIARFKNTLTDLSEIAKIQAGSASDSELIRFEEVTSSVLEDIKELITQSKAAVTEDYIAEEVTFSRKNLRSIIYNLISNAVKYKSPDRNPIVEVKTYTEPDFIVLSVKDNGLGIREEDKAKVFTIFKRLHTHVEGTGIGMSIVKKIVDSYGGKIEIESKINEGTSFKVYFKKEFV